MKDEKTNTISLQFGLATSIVFAVLVYRHRQESWGRMHQLLRQRISKSMNQPWKGWRGCWSSGSKIRCSSACLCQESNSLHMPCSCGHGRLDKITHIDIKASNGLFERFKNRTSILNFMITGEAATSDQPAVENIQEILASFEQGIEMLKDIDSNPGKSGMRWKRLSAPIKKSTTQS